MPAAFMEKTGIFLLSGVVLVALVVMLFAGLGYEYAQTRDAISTSQHQWCAALHLLTAQSTGVQAPNPAKQPNAYHLRQDFLLLEKEFRCG